MPEERFDHSLIRDVDIALDHLLDAVEDIIKKHGEDKVPEIKEILEGLYDAYTFIEQALDIEQYLKDLEGDNDAE